MRVIGTAGHVDHGKSTLVQRLTGINPDRLAEEQTREMTIDLGFAWLILPNGETVGIVDVPGHRDFIENMLAGVGGIDAAVLVIAADEGVMPQTREHLAILDLLGIKNGLVALTKTDLIDDTDWLELVETDVRETLLGTSLEAAPILPVSAHTGDGIDTFVSQLTNLLTNLPPHHNYQHPRLPIDRIFTISGFGTVVTGTLSGGSLSVGDEVEIQPGRRQGRIRGLQSYKQSVESALPGSRVAVNISGIDKREITRGEVLTHPGQIFPTMLVDVHFHYLPDAGRPLKHNAEVKFFSGAAETVANVRLLADNTLSPGADGWLQLRLHNPIPLTQRDRFILRYPSPPQTIGGGIIVNPNPGRRWKRFRQDIIEQLETRLQGTPAERVVQAVEGDTPQKRSAIQKMIGFSDVELDTALREAQQAGSLFEFPDGNYLAMSSYHTMIERMIAEIRQFHQMEPLRLGIPREELRSRLGMKQAVMNMFLDTQDQIIAQQNLLRQTDHEIQFTEEQQSSIDALMSRMMATPYAPPSFTEAVTTIGESVLYALIDLSYIIQVKPDVIFTREAYEEMVTATLETIDNDGSVSAKSLRDRLGTTRKYVIGLLEYLDSVGITRRVGDERVRGRNSKL